MAVAGLAAPLPAAGFCELDADARRREVVEADLADGADAADAADLADGADGADGAGDEAADKP